jgi:4-hydroxybenzoate polyprenyltransferase
MALAFTALADSLCALMLWAGQQGDVWHNLPLRQVGLMALTSAGLYGFGMSLNDIIDRRRDTQLAAHRPLPSGRIKLTSAQAVCGGLGLLAVAAGALYSIQSPGGFQSLVYVAFTIALILFYDLIGKYLVALGLLTLGLIRFFHAAIAAPPLPVVWQPMLLLNHIVLLSTVSYHWEQKRPALTRTHWWSVLGGLAAIDVALVALLILRRGGDAGSLAELARAIGIRPGLMLPASAAVIFASLGVAIHRHHHANPRQAGQTLMLVGLLWLIVYDACFVAGYVALGPALIVLMLLPVAYLSVQLMRWWSQLVVLSQRPEFKRAGG